MITGPVIQRLVARQAFSSSGFRSQAFVRLSSSGIRSTIPSTSKPEKSSALKTRLSKDDDDGDRGYLAFTKSSLYK
jgi:hypothetical protein